MPALLDPNNSASFNSSDLTERNYGYEYPDGLDLRPGSALHNKILGEVIARARASYSCMQSRHASWNKIDETLTAYMPLSEEEELVKQKDERKPVSVVIPMSYAILDTLITYMVTTYLNEENLFKYSPVSPEDTIGALLLEKVVSQQCWRSKIGLALHTTWRDSIAYGIGISTPVWYKQMGKKRMSVPTGFNSGVTGEFVETGSREEVQDIVKYEGNRVDPIDPYCYLPDPNVAAHEIQRGEYVGWFTRDSFVGMLMREKSEAGFFNCKYLRHIDGHTSVISRDASRRDKHKVRPSRSVDNTTKPVDNIFMYIKLIPKDWQLGASDYPETWVFGVSGDQVVVMANKVDLDHGMFPVAVSAPDSDGYSVSPISRLEILSGMQTTVDWLISSHVTNIRKAINDMLIVDPSLINVNDLIHPSPGKLIRTKRSAWGQGLDNAIKQLNVTDVTRQHITDATILTDLMQKAGAAPDSLQGIMRQGGERRSATESRDTRVSAFSRVDKMVILSNLQSMVDLGLMIASQTQQFMSQDSWLQFEGSWPEQLMAEMQLQPGMYKVTPQELNVLFDVKVADGSPSGGEFVDTWLNLLQIVQNNPELSMKMDVVRMFQHVARLAGSKNMNEFVRKGGAIQTQVMPDEEVAKQVHAGNMRAVGMNGGGAGGVNV